MLQRFPLAILAFAFLAVFALAEDAAPPTVHGLTRYDHCKLIPTEWADGDSFLVEVPDGKQHTVRLYGADTIEWHVTDSSDARRLRAQRRYFGIFGPDPQTSIEQAKKLGEEAALKVRELLEKPFTLYTAHADARGDGRHKRIYGFVITSDGRDLSAELVRLGLARAHGVSRTTPDGVSRDDYRDSLQDLELQAARRGRGIWKHTNWDTLPEERRAERLEEAEEAMATGTAPELPDGFQLNPNTAARDELMRLPGVGEVIANRIIEHRPYKTIDDLRNVPGIGEKSLENLRPHLMIKE